MENVVLLLHIEKKHNLFVNSAVWMNYVGLIGDPREPNSNSLLVWVQGLEEGPLYCSAQLTGCCFNGRWEINGNLMTVGRTQCNNRGPLQRRPSTLVSQGNYLHGCTHKYKYTHRNILLIPRNWHTNILTDAHTVKMKVPSIDLSVEKFCSHQASSAPCLTITKTNWANSQAANPPVWQKKDNLCIGDMVCEE